MADELITFIIEGAPERNGAVTAETFIAKLRQFVATVYAFERAFTKREHRNIDLEIVDLSRGSPATVKLNPRSRALGYYSQPAMRWTFEQIDRVQKGEPIDESIPQKAIDNVIELAKHQRERDFSLLKAEYDSKSVCIDSALEARALVLRETRRMEAAPTWQRGMSRGSLFGELRGVMDFDGERKFYILPPSGPAQIECIFPEVMRERMNENLFKVVRVRGFLRYDGSSPFPFLMEADEIDGVPIPGPERFADLRGLFRGYEQPEVAEVF